MKKTRLFCGRLDETLPPRKVTYWGFYPGIFTARLAAHKNGEIFEVDVLEFDGNEDEALYWGWWDNKRLAFIHIYYNKGMVGICFPYGPKAAEEAGDGKLMPVQVELIRQVPGDEPDELKKPVKERENTWKLK